MITPPYPSLDECITWIGEAGKRMSEIEACEGAAGNISACLRWPVEIDSRFSCVEQINLPLLAPELVGATFIVTGSGRRLRDILPDPLGNLGILVIEPGVKTGRLYTSPRRQFSRLTSEFNSHLAIHYGQALASGTNFNAIIHAQPPHITYLSHIPKYQNELTFNRHVLRWEPESIINFPEGIGVIPFCVPGTLDLAAATARELRSHKLVIWARHGVVARDDGSVMHAADLIEYAEAGARYEYQNLCAGEPSSGLSPEEIREVCRTLGIQQEIF